MNRYHDLAEAMRKGAALRPQVQNSMFGEASSGRVGSCAIGAALEGKIGSTNFTDEQTSLDYVASLFNLPHWDLVPTPDGNFTTDVLDTIVDLNDRQGWTREAVADWLDTLQVQP